MVRNVGCLPQVSHSPNLFLCLLPEVTIFLNFGFIIPKGFLKYLFSLMYMCLNSVFFCFILTIIKVILCIDWDIFFSLNIVLPRLFHVVEYSYIIFHLNTSQVLILLKVGLQVGSGSVLSILIHVSQYTSTRIFLGYLFISVE